MASDKPSADHKEQECADHEAALTGVVALASLFSNCVEAFGLIHATHRWDKDEQVLLARLGVQQARLLIWGDVLGVPSPPPSVTDRAVPRRPSAAYPDLTEPTIFNPRDPRLDEPEMRKTIEAALSAIVDRPFQHSRDEMMANYGMKAPKKSSFRIEPALDTNRLEAFRERHELLQEVAESYANLNAYRAPSIIQNSWMIVDTTKFANFISLIQEKVDFLINLMDVKERVDRGMRMDIRSFGWHLSADRLRLSQDSVKLRNLDEICQVDYPEYVTAIRQALDNIVREARENGTDGVLLGEPRSNTGAKHTNSGHDSHESRRPSVFKLFKFGKSRDDSTIEPQRSKSDSGPSSSPAAYSTTAAATTPGTERLGRIRSKSVGAYIDPPVEPDEPSPLTEKVADLSIAENVRPRLVPTTSNPGPIRHDQYHGIARTETKNLHQADY